MALIFSCSCPWLLPRRSRLEHEARPSHCLEQGRLSVLFELAPQIAHIDIQQAGVTHKPFAPHAIENHLAADDLIWSTQQKEE